MKPRVIVTRKWPDAVEKQLQEHFDVSLNKNDVAFTTQQFQAALTDYDAVLSTVTDRLDASVFETLERNQIKARIIGNYGVGFSHIDMEAAKRLELAVTNTPDVLSECTADLALMLMLMVARRAGEGERELRANNWTGWRPTHMVGRKFSGAVLGIVGFGRIGKETARRALAFGMQIKIYNRSRVEDAVLKEFGAVQLDSIEALAREVDFLSLHFPGGAGNTKLIGQQILASMKPSAYLINTARGEVIDESALIEAIESKQIAGAGLDVYVNEPCINSALTQLQNVVLLPHLGSATESTRNGMGFRVIENLLAFFAGEAPRDRVA